MRESLSALEKRRSYLSLSYGVHFLVERKVKIEQLIADMRVARKERKAVKCRVST